MKSRAQGFVRSFWVQIRYHGGTQCASEYSLSLIFSGVPRGLYIICTHTFCSRFAQIFFREPTKILFFLKKHLIALPQNEDGERENGCTLSAYKANTTESPYTLSTTYSAFCFFVFFFRFFLGLDSAHGWPFIRQSRCMPNAHRILPYLKF